MGELNAAHQIRKQKSHPRKYQKRDQVGQGSEAGGSDSVRDLQEIQGQEDKMNFALFSKLVTYARKHKIAKVTFGDISFELTGQSFLSPKEKREIQRLMNPTPKEQKQMLEEDLFYSSL